MALKEFDGELDQAEPQATGLRPFDGELDAPAEQPSAPAAPRRGTMRGVTPFVGGDQRTGFKAGDAGGGRGFINPGDDPAVHDANANLVTGGQLVKDLKGGVEQVKGLTRAAGAFAGATDYRATADALQDFDAIDAGQQPTKTGARVMRTDGPSNVVEPGAVAKAYMQGTPEQRAQLRAGAADALTRDKNFIADSVKAVLEYKAAQEKESGKILDFTDINSPTGFANWLSRTGVSAAPTMAAAMLGAAAGPLGFAVTSGGMAVGDLTQARIEHTAAANDPAQAQPSERAEVAANRDENMAKDLASNVGTTAALAVPYAALDLMGPVGAALRGPGKEIAGQTVKQVLKQGARELPKQMGEEFVNEAGQEVVGVAGDILAGERPAVVTGDDAKRVFNAGMAGVAMAPGGHVANVAREAVAAGQASPANQVAGAIDSGSAAVDPQTADAVARGAFDPNRGAAPAPAEAPAGTAVQPEPTTQPLSPYDAARAKGFHVEPPYINDAPTVQRSKTTAIFESLGAAYGLPKKAIDAALAAADGRSLTDLGPYLSRVLAAYQKRGLVGRPVDPEALGTLTAGPVPPVEKEGKKPAEKPADIGVAAVPQGDLAARAAAAMEPAPVEEPAAAPVAPVITETASAINEGAHQAATSPANDLPEPTEAQKAAGNYKVGRVNVHGMDISVENPAGSVRQGVDPDGKPWRTDMAHHYGYVRGSEGNDGDHFDVFIGPNPDSRKVFVVDQVNPDGSFDEHKGLIGFDSLEQARAGYLSNYSQDWTGLGAITEMPVDAFKSWVRDGAKRKPLALATPESGAATPAPAAGLAAVQPTKEQSNGNPETSRTEERDQAPGESGIPAQGSDGAEAGRRAQDGAEAPLTRQLADLAGEFDGIPTSIASTFAKVLRSYVKDLDAGRIELGDVADKVQTYTELLDRARQSHAEAQAAPAPVEAGPALEHKQNADGTVIVFGKSADIKAALPGIRGVTGTRGVTFGRSVAARVLELLERDANGQTETRQRNAEADVQNVDGDEASVHGPDAQDVSEVRRVRDQGVSGVDGELRGVSGGGRRATEHGAPNRSNRERKGLRAGQRALGNKGGAGSKQDLQSTADGQRGNSDTGAVVRADGTASNDDSQPAESRLVRAGRRDIEAAATQQLGTDDRVPGADSVGDAVGKAAGDQGKDTFESSERLRVDAGDGTVDPSRGSGSASIDQTETPAFKRWFGASQVVDAAGKPLIVYHGTSTAAKDGDAYNSFETYGSNYGLFGQGSYFTVDPSIAGEYTSKGRGKSATIYPAYLSIQNAIDMDAKAERSAWEKGYPDVDFDQWTPDGDTNEAFYRAVEDELTDQGLPKYEGAEVMQDGLRRMGFDGITHMGGGRVNNADTAKRHRVFIVFDPEQVKSATGNNGEFDPKNADIRFQRAGDSTPEQNALKALSENDAMFRYGKSDATTLEGIVADLDPRAKVKQNSKSGIRTDYQITLPNGGFGRLVVREANPYAEFPGQANYGQDYNGNVLDSRPGSNPEDVPFDKGDIWIDVSMLKGSGDGQQLYNIAANFAHNTGRVFIGDPNGLSNDALRRRTENMLSSALKFGTTEHIAPHPRQVEGDPKEGAPPIKWVYGDDLDNIKRLIDANLASLHNAGADAINFDPQSGQFTDSEGQPFPRSGFAATATLPAARAARAGDSTLARGSVLRAISQAESGRDGSRDGRPAGLLESLLRLSAVHPETTDRLFYSRQGVDTPTDGAHVAEVQQQVDDIRKGWANSPPVVVLASMADAPEKVRLADHALLEQGAESHTSAFTWGGKVYIVASQMRSEAMVASAMFHEALGHRGLRGAFGGALDTVLRQTAAALPDKIAAKIAEYGLDPTSQKDRLIAAEEVLAELAETRPSSTWVQKAVAAIKTWLRENVAAFKNLTLTDADVIAQFIVPARNFIERGPAAEAGGTEALAFQRTKPGKPGAFTLPEFGRTGAMIEAIQDRYNRWKQATSAVRAQGGNVDEANDFYRAEERYWGKVGSQIDDFNDELKEFVKAVSKDKLDLGSVALYAYAQHAKERNDWIAAKRPGMPDGGSGMTTADAQQIIDEARHSGTEAELKKHAATLRSWIAGTRTILLRNGLIDQAEHDAWANMFQNYVPLRGLEGKTEGKGTGRGFDVRGKEGKEAKGRKSEAKDIIERIIQDRTRALVRSGKNEVLRSFLQFVLDNPSPNLWKVDAVQSRPVSTVDANGNRVLEEGTAKITDERTVAVKDGGKEIHILVKDQRLREQLQNLHVENVGRVVGAMHYVNRLLSRLYTSLSPTFTVLNGARDLMESTVNIIDELGFLAAPKLWANMPMAIIESFKAEFGKKTRDYQLYRETGGKTGFFDLKNIDTQAAELSALLKDADRWRINPVKAWRKALHVIEAINGGIENATRLAAFKTARQAGKSLSEAARISKNISVNFNRKGTMTPALGAWFLFFNPAVQGTARVIQAVQNPKVVATLGFGMVGIASLALMNAGVGDDDDGVAWWDKIPDEVKERNVVIVLPPGATAGEKVPGSKIGRYIKIPMPYGYSFFAALANQVADGWRHQQDPKRGRTKSEAVVKAINAFLNSFIPVSELSKSVENPKSAVLAAVPDAFNPIAQNILNINSFGRKMYPDDATSENQPDSSRYFPGAAGTIFQRGAEGLNKATGGTRYQSGLLDLTPASIENLARGYGGGPANFSLDVLNALYVRQNISRPDLDTRRLPFVKQLYGVIDDETDRLVGQQRMDKVQKVMDPLKRAMREGASDDAKALVKEAGTIAGLGGALTTTRKMLAQIRKGELAVIGDDKMSEAAKYEQLQTFAGQRRKVMQGFSRAYDDAIELQAAQEATKARQAQPAAAARP